MRGCQGIHAQAHRAQVADPEIERRLIELGFIEGAEVQIHHEGFFGPYPIAVQINGAMHPGSDAGFTR